MSTHTHTHFIKELMNSVTGDLALSACICLVILNITLKTSILQAPREIFLSISCPLSLNYKHMAALSVFRLCHC